MATCRYIGNSSIIVAECECMTLRNDMLAAKRKSFLNLEIEDGKKKKDKLL